MNSQIQLNKIEENFIFVFDCFILARKRSFLVSSVFLWFFEKRRKKQCFSFYSFFVLQSMFVFVVFNLMWLTSGRSAWNLFPDKTIVRHFSVLHQFSNFWWQHLCAETWQVALMMSYLLHFVTTNMNLIEYAELNRHGVGPPYSIFSVMAQFQLYLISWYILGKHLVTRMKEILKRLVTFQTVSKL